MRPRRLLSYGHMRRVCQLSPATINARFTTHGQKGAARIQHQHWPDSTSSRVSGRQDVWDPLTGPTAFTRTRSSVKSMAQHRVSCATAPLLTLYGTNSGCAIHDEIEATFTIEPRLPQSSRCTPKPSTQQTLVERHLEFRGQNEPECPGLDRSR